MAAVHKKECSESVENKKKCLCLQKLECFSKHMKNIKSNINKIIDTGKWQFLARKSLNPCFTPFGTLKLAQSDLPLSIYRKTHSLYESTLDAKSVLLRYKSDLSTVVVGLEDDCLTPLAASKKLPMVFYKREDLTSIKAYKIRGALYQMSKIIEENHSKNLHFVAASTGNHALGVLKAAEILMAPKVTICISESVTDFKKQKLQKRIKELQEKKIDASLLIKGENFDQTNKIAKGMVEKCSETFYIDPYNNHNAVAGQGTIGLELITQLESQFFNYEKLDYDYKALKKLKEITLIIPIGGGGLISGISGAFKMEIQNNNKFSHVKVKVIGVKLKDLHSKYGDAIKVKTFGEHNQELIRHLVDKKVKVTDMDMQRGINFINDDIGVKVEGASAATLKPIFENLVVPSEENAVICILSGGNVTF